MVGDDEVQEAAPTEEIKRSQASSVQRASARAGRVPSKDHELFGQSLNLRHDRGREP